MTPTLTKIELVPPTKDARMTLRLHYVAPGPGSPTYYEKHTYASWDALLADIRKRAEEAWGRAA